MIVGRSYPEYVLVKSFIYLFRYPGIGALVYFFAALAIGGIPGISHPFSIAVESIGAIEILFYLFWFLPYKAHLQKAARFPAPLTQDERSELYFKALDYIPDVEFYIRKWLLNAHMDDLRRENVKDWLLWALFDRTGFPGDDDDELEDYISAVEEMLDMKIKPGRGEAKALLINFNEISMTHRSLFFYSIIGLLDTVTTLVLLIKGFKFYRQPRKNFFTVFPLRPMTLISPTESSAPGLSYFYRPHKSKGDRPIVLLHGIGIGIFPYLPLLLSLPKEIGIIIVEILPVSSRITHQNPLLGDFISSLSSIITQQDFQDFVLVGHSYGTLLAKACLNTPLLSSRINSLVLIDPVSILLHLPDVAYNFAARVPKKGNEWQLWYIQTDPGISSTLGRRFCWRESVLWRENLQGRRATIVVAENDTLLNANAIASYVASGSVDWTYADLDQWRQSTKEWDGSKDLELFWLDGQDHGQSFMNLPTLPKLVNIISTYCKIGEILESGPTDGNVGEVEEVEEV